MIFRERIVLDDVLGAEAHVHVADHRLEQLAIDVAVTDDVAARDQAAVRRHDTRVGLDQVREPLERPNTCAEPGAVAVVEERPLLAGDDAAGDEHVPLRKVDVQIAVGVRRGQVAVIELPTADIERAFAARRLGRSCGLGQRIAPALERRGRHSIAQIHRGLLVRENLAARAADELVRAGLLGVPVRVDQRLNSAGSRRGVDGAQQRVRVRGKAAVDHQRAVGAA